MNSGSMPVTMHALTLRGFVMQPELLTGLSNLALLGEGSALHLGETRTGIVAFLRCQNAMQVDDRWSVEYDDARGKFTYSAKFEVESAPEIVSTIRRLVESSATIPRAA